MNGVESSLMKLNAASKAALNSKITAQISQLTKEVTKATAAFADMNAKEDAAAAESAAGRAKLAESVAAEKAAAKEALDDNVATLTRSLLALKKETQKKIKKTN